MSVFAYELDNDGIVTITMDMTGPVNAMNEEFNVAMAATVDRLEAQEGLKGVIFSSAKSTFFAGGDLKELLKVEKQDVEAFYQKALNIKSWLRRLERLPVPVVAAINGAALGGGYELCLSCNYRVAVNDRAVQIGLPEVSLGLLPGAGGVVRLTHLLGFEKALPYLLEGKKVKAEKALAEGMVDALVDSVESLIPHAKEWILDNAADEQSAQQPWDRKGYRITGGDMNSRSVYQTAQFAPVMLQNKTRGLLPAPERILETAVEVVRVDFDTAQEVETRNFISLVTSPIAKNMISTFFFQMNKVNGGASRPAGIAPNQVKKIGVIGAGMMGQGISHVSAMAGIQVVLKDVSQEAADKGKAYSEGLLKKAVSRGRMDETKMQAVLGLIEPTDKHESLKGCDLIVEAVFEKLELKHAITRDTEALLDDSGVWGSNTSSLPISRLAEASTRPENFIGIHFFSPVDKMPLVELICGDKTSDETLAKAFDFVRQIRKTPIVVNDKVGFFTSRTFATQLFEAAQLITEGVHPIRIDALGKAIGMPVGPLTVHDEISQRLAKEIEETQVSMGLKVEGDDPTPAATAMLKNMVEEHNRGGRYHGDGGYYNYEDGSKSLWEPILEYYREDVAISDQDIKDRLLFRCVIESLKCLEEGVLTSVADGNIGSIMGIGAPAWTGGYLQFVNTYGLQAFIDRCDELAESYGPRFKAPAIVAEKLAAGETFQ